MVTSPEATGEAGAFFEQHVDAAFLAFLLVRGRPPFLLDARLSELHLQSGHLGWATDDLLLVGACSDGGQRLAALQVKRTFALTPSNEDCIDVFSRAWEDFESERFTKGRDVVGLVTRPFAQKPQHGLRILLDTARAAMDGADLFHRLELPGYRQPQALKAAKTIRGIVGAEEEKVSDDDLLVFLRHFDFVCVDLNTPSSAHEALLLGLLQAHALPDAGVDAPRRCWNALLALVGRSMPEAASLTYDKLPEDLKKWHKPAGASDEDVVSQIAEVTSMICDGTRESIGGCHVSRAQHQQEVLSALEEQRVVVLVGHAGCGKSAVAKSVFEQIAQEHCSFALRADMLGQAHLVGSLAAQQIPLRRLRHETALHPRKLLWIESAERLLEKGEAQRGAFKDLLGLAKKDSTWKLLITCRSYSIETFRSALLEGEGVASSLVVIPEFSDDELDQVAASHPKLRLPLEHPRLRTLLRNPFLLGKATQMDWSDEATFPTTRRSFRTKLWREVVRRDDDVADGMPQRRSECFKELAQRRAHALTAFVPIGNLDSAALQKLKMDSLAFESDANDLWAPAHDVLEDWALLEWLDGEFLKTSDDWVGFLEGLGTHPAVRRSFRMWLSERTESGEAEDLAKVLCQREIQAHWKDDVLVAILTSRAPATFLGSNQSLLLEEDAGLLRRSLHLARVACKEAPADLTGARSSMLLVPVGPAWAALADFVAKNIDIALRVAGPLVLQFLEDWSLQCTVDAPYPAGSDAVAKIATRMMRGQDLSRQHRSGDGERILRVMLTIPTKTKSSIDTIADEVLSDEYLDTRHLFIRNATSLLYGAQLCRDNPELILRVLRRLIQSDDKEDGDDGNYGSSTHRREMEHAFGLPEHLHDLGFPASAYHGPFFQLLRCHLSMGVSFIVEMVNEATAHYLSSDRAGPTYELAIDLPNGTSVVHKGDGALWNMYRVNCGPEFLRSALMALEKILLQIGDQVPDCLPAALLRIMSESESVALTSVAVSVAMAFPELGGAYVLPVLRTPVVVDWDRARYVGDRSNGDRQIAEMFGALNEEDAIYKQERANSADLPHRNQNLTLLVLKLQQSELRSKVWEILDFHNETLPPPNEQDEEDKLWRLALHRMDLRTFEAKGEPKDGLVAFQPSDPPPDVQEVIDANQPEIETHEVSVSLSVWAHSCHENGTDPAYSIDDWRDKLVIARSFDANEPPRYADPRLLVAVVCVRDRFEEMVHDDRAWCVSLIVSVFEAEPDAVAQFPYGTVSGEKEASTVLGHLLTCDLNEELVEKVKSALLLALLSADGDIGHHAAVGIGRDLWPANRDLALSFVNALVTHTRLTHDAEKLRHRGWPRQDEPEYEIAVATALTEAKRIAADEIPANKESLRHDYRTRPWRYLLRRIASMLVHQSGEPVAHDFFGDIGEQLRTSWGEELNIGYNRGSDERCFDHSSEHLIVNALSNFAVSLDAEASAKQMAPFAALAGSYPRKVAALAKELAYTGDRYDSRDAFWASWFGLSSALAKTIDGRRDADVEREMARSVFLCLEWKETTTDWKQIEGHESDIQKMYSEIPPNIEATEAFVRFLHKIGAVLLPDAIIVLASKLSATTPLSGNAIYTLELVLANLVHGGNSRVRRFENLQSATLALLDALIDGGSSLAYKLRDDFVTPLPVD